MLKAFASNILVATLVTVLLFAPHAKTTVEVSQTPFSNLTVTNSGGSGSTGVGTCC